MEVVSHVSAGPSKELQVTVLGQPEGGGSGDAGDSAVSMPLGTWGHVCPGGRQRPEQPSHDQTELPDPQGFYRQDFTWHSAGGC